MYRVGLTGGVGSGKSEVAAMLRDAGAIVVTADAIARDLVRPGSAGLGAIIEAFGPGILNEDGTLDRRSLAAIVFTDRGELSRLNAILRRPLVEAILDQVEGLERAGERGPVVVDAALLLDWDIADAFDVIVAVRAPLERRLRRLEQAGVSRDDAMARVGSQRTDEEFTQGADLVIDNDGSLEQLRERVAELWAGLQERLEGEEP